MPQGAFVQGWALGTPGGKAVHFQGPKTGTATWIKITLSPEAIVFAASTDGKAWEELGRLPRKGFEGAPSQLVLGNAHGDGQKLFTNSGRAQGAASFFGDLVTAPVEPTTQPARTTQADSAPGK